MRETLPNLDPEFVPEAFSSAEKWCLSTNNAFHKTAEEKQDLNSNPYYRKIAFDDVALMLLPAAVFSAFDTSEGSVLPFEYFHDLVMLAAEINSKFFHDCF